MKSLCYRNPSTEVVQRVIRCEQKTLDCDKFSRQRIASFWREPGRHWTIYQLQECEEFIQVVRPDEEELSWTLGTVIHGLTESDEESAEILFCCLSPAQSEKEAEVLNLIGGSMSDGDSKVECEWGGAQHGNGNPEAESRAYSECVRVHCNLLLDST